MRIFWAFSQAGQARFFGQYDVSLHFITVAREIISVGMHHQRDKLHTPFFFVCSYFKYWPSNTCIFICALYYENIWEGTFPALQTYANIWQTWNCRRSAKNPRLAPKLAVQAKRRWWELLCIIYSLIVADLEFGIFDLYTVPYVCTILYGQPIELISTLYHVTWRVLMRFHFWFDIIINCIGGFYLYHDRHLE